MKPNLLPFYNLLTEEGQSTLRRNLTQASCSRGQIVLENGDTAYGMVFVEKGLLSASLLCEEGREITLFRLRKGDVCFLTATTALEGISFDITLEAETDVRLSGISESCLTFLMKQSPAFAEYVHASVAGNFSDTVTVLQSVLFHRFHERLATFLADEMDGTRSSVLYVTHEEIARHLGSAREMVTRTLKRLSEEGIVTLSRGAITVVDRDALRKIAR